MQRKFLFTLISGWAINPAALMFAHWLGFSNSPSIHLALQASAALTPLQFLLNEVVSPAASKRKIFLHRSTIVRLAFIQALCTSAIFINTPIKGGDTLFLYLAIVLFTILSLVLSGLTSLSYTSLALAGMLTHRQALIAGFIPGLTVLSVYAAYAIMMLFVNNAPESMLLLQAVLPGAAQYFYIRTLIRRAGLKHKKSESKPTKWGAPLLILLVAAPMLYMREEISKVNVLYSSFILLGLNMLFSLGMVISKARALNSGSVAKAKEFSIWIYAIAPLFVVVILAVGHRTGVLGWVREPEALLILYFASLIMLSKILLSLRLNAMSEVDR